MDVKNFLKGGDEKYFEIYSHNDQFIGFTVLEDFKEQEGTKQCEFSIFILDKNFWGQGIGFKATREMLGYGFNDFKMDKIILTTSEFNHNAIRLYKKIGFRKVKSIADRRLSFVNNQWIYCRSVFMEIKKEDFDLLN